jgi:signal transduction histidine kinase
MPKALGIDHSGLMGMQERAQLVGAQVDVDTAPDQGTAITALAPTT